MKSMLNKGAPRAGAGKEETKRKSSLIFTQLGLVLALLLVYMAIESTSASMSSGDSGYIPTNIDDFTEQMEDVVIERPKEEVTKAKPEPKVEVVELDIKDDTTDVLESDVFSTDAGEDVKIELKIEDIVEIVIDDVERNDVPFRAIEDAPIFPGCKGTKEEIKKCFSKSVNKFVGRKFDSELGQELGLSSGRQRISVQFTVDATGNISNVKVRAPHKRLEKEARRVVNLLPKMTPGKQRKVPVGVKFNLPIVFEVIE